MAGELYCPMCDPRATQAATLDLLLWDLIEWRCLSEDAEAVLRTIWAGSGLAVHSETIFDAMYADDPDGGPRPQRMYEDLRNALAELANLLRDTGLVVIDCGKGKGWRVGLVPGGAYVL